MYLFRNHFNCLIVCTCKLNQTKLNHRSLYQTNNIFLLLFSILFRQFAVRIMGMDEKLHQKIFEDNLSLIDTPLIATTTNTIYHPGAGSSHSHKDLLPYPYPINLTEFYHRHNMAQEVTIIPDVIDTGIGYSSMFYFLFNKTKPI